MCHSSKKRKQISLKVSKNICKTTTKSPNSHYSHLNHYLLLHAHVEVVGDVVVVREMVALGWAGLEGVVDGMVMGWIEFFLVEATMS